MGHEIAQYGLKNKTKEKIYKEIMGMEPSEIITLISLCTKLEKKYSDDHDFQIKIFSHIVDKLRTNNKSDNATMVEALYYLAKAKIVKNQDKEAVIKLNAHTEAINSLEIANILLFENPVESKVEPLKLIEKTIEEYTPTTDTFTLAEYSIEKRRKFDKKYKDGASNNLVYKACMLATEVANILDDNAIKIKALEYVTEAYNRSPENEKLAYKCLAEMARIHESFGDLNKVKLFQKIAKEATSSQEKENSDELESATEVKDEFTFKPLIRFSHASEEELTLKQEMKSNLDNITEAAANGKWYNMQVTGQNGVSGYIDSQWKNTDEGVRKLELVFEAICTGIMLSDSKNPIVAVIFAKEYPKIVENILNNHPEYFIDAHVLRSVVLDIQEYSEVLLGESLEEDLKYNKYLESTFTPIVEARIENQVLNTAGDIINSGAWNNNTRDQLLNLISSNNLTGGKIQSGVLGNNLGLAQDAVDVARILAIKTVVKAIKDTESTNNEPVKALASEYPEIMHRVLTDHKDDIGKGHLYDVAVVATSSSLKEKAAKEAEEKAAEEEVDSNQSILPTNDITEDNEVNATGDLPIESAD